MGLAGPYDYLEADHLNLKAEHFPFPVSLLDLVMDRFALPRSPGVEVHAMELDELLGYLKNTQNFDISPWAAILEQTDAIGDPAVPSPEQSAVLRWLGEALDTWEKQYPLEEPLAATVRRLKPVAAAAAIRDPDFLKPGAHPIHLLLDTIQAHALGWQERLDRAGAALQQQVTSAVEDSRQLLEQPGIDLAAISTWLSESVERDQSRARRMVQRLVETEVGKVRTAGAKDEAARMINASLEKYHAPQEIGEFIKGPWYNSAQLLLLKFGADSEQWQKMCATTDSLLDSLQDMEDATEARRQEVFEAVTQLPKEMRRWLLSLHHDTEAVNDAMGLVEFAHLRILRRQPLELQQITPIESGEDQKPEDARQHSEVIKHWGEGQWFLVDRGEDGMLRAQLVFKSEETQQLLFANQAGIKVMELGFAQFVQLIAMDKVTPLYSGASFSLCLAHAAGIKSPDMLEALVQAQLAPGETAIAPSASTPEPNPAPLPDTGAELALEPDSHSEADPEPFLDLDLDLDLGLDLELESNNEQSDLASQALDAELAERVTVAQQAPEAENLTSDPVDSTVVPAAEQDTPPGSEDADETRPEAAGILSAEDEPAAANDGYLSQPADEPGIASEFSPEEQSTEDLLSEEIAAPGDAERFLSGENAAPGDADRFLSEEKSHQDDTDRFLSEDNSGPDDADRFLSAETTEPDEADSLLSDPGELPGSADGFLSPAEAAADTGFLSQQDTSGDGFLADPGELPDFSDSRVPAETAFDEPAVAPAEQEKPGEDNASSTGTGTAQDVEINLPMGAWLGFHDGETPIMAKLAVHDPDGDYYIFVNRQGVKLRQLSSQQLLDLVDRNMVDILETRSNFREEVVRTRKRLDQ